ncbi:hypothetical protein ACH9D2_18705 [Kocuria sp. M4R2S49]|uniref:hypothetical protein n=1 Tax=Kocuria rhizosphaericola TaxID=3376284 RepID=UPI003792F4D6
MTDRAEQGTPEFTRFMPWRIRIPIAAVIFAVMPVALASVPLEPVLLWRLLVVAVGAVAFNRLVLRSLSLQLDDRAVRIRLGRCTVEIAYEQITEVTVGPRTPWWQVGRRRLDDGSTGYLVGGPSVRISTGTESVVVSAAESYRVAGAIQRQREHAADERATGAEQAGR